MFVGCGQRTTPGGIQPPDIAPPALSVPLGSSSVFRTLEVAMISCHARGGPCDSSFYLASGPSCQLFPHTVF